MEAPALPKQKKPALPEPEATAPTKKGSLSPAAAARVRAKATKIMGC